MANFDDKYLPPAVIEALKNLGLRIKQARLRRNESQDMIARRIGITRTTQHRLESGHPGTTLAVLLNNLFVLGLLDSFDETANPDKDSVGKALEKKHLPKKAKKKTEEFNSDF